MANSLRLSVLDQSPIHDGGPPSRGPADTVRLAKACDALGYYRYWIAEHHSTPGYASPAPEILIGHLAQNTRRLRVGSGGIMLPHYSPLKVAEVFRMLETLNPGRIDLGVGRATGADGLGTAALAFPHQPIDAQLYPRQVYDVMGFLNGDMPDEHPFREVRAEPVDGGVPEVWMLGSSGGSAEVAGQLGAGLVLSLFIGTHPRTPAIIESYRKAFQPSASLAEPRAIIGVACVCDEDAARAQRVAGCRTMWLLQALARGRIMPLPSPEQAWSLYDELTPGERDQFDQLMANTVYGTPEHCHAEITRQAEQYGVDEVMVVCVTHSFASRLQTYELLAQAFDLPGEASAAA